MVSAVGMVVSVVSDGGEVSSGTSAVVDVAAVPEVVAGPVVIGSSAGVMPAPSVPGGCSSFWSDEPIVGIGGVPGV